MSVYACWEKGAELAELKYQEAVQEAGPDSSFRLDIEQANLACKLYLYKGFKFCLRFIINIEEAREELDNDLILAYKCKKDNIKRKRREQIDLYKNGRRQLGGLILEQRMVSLKSPL